MDEEARMQWMYYDALAEGTYNPFKRLYYRLKMRGLERMDAKKETVQFTLRFDKDLHKRFRIQCVKDERSMNDVILEIIDRYMEQKERDGKQA